MRGTGRAIKIVSGGQTGADRAALDAAIALGLDYGGWCPRGGWAEDMPDPPGLLAKYPALRETPSKDPAKRTRWNLRDSDRTLILVDARGLAHSQGTALTLRVAERTGKPHLVADVDEAGAAERIAAWLADAAPDLVLNVAGPRESGAPGIYRKARALLTDVLDPSPAGNRSADSVVVHGVTKGTAMRNIRGLISSLAMAGLAATVATPGTAATGIDTSQSITINAPAEEVWRALTTPELRRQWFFGVDTTTDWKAGSPIVHKGELNGKPYEDKGVIVKIEPPALLVHTHWSKLSGLPGSPENYQEVTYALAERDGVTELTVSETNLPSEEAKAMSDKAWKKALGDLKKLVE